MDDDSVFLHLWHALPQAADEVSLLERWNRIRSFRAQVQKQLEDLRVAGSIGSSLQAEVEIAASPETYALLAPLGDDLRFVLITSAARLRQADQDSVKAEPSTWQKCERCWHYREDVGIQPNHPTLCGRCHGNLYGEGEQRVHA
jgi:isoleucyl-tRNA synthetase